MKAALPGVTYTGVTGVIAFDDIGTKKLMAKTASAHMKKL